mmetsp:Transcript_15726/g.40384  ORF Transcript_15726/g.40384 Transcript_15726/m.40384 type:complete len:158 (-) Transcript_15726:300-773(-)|eukprot:CAMPEP_0174914458 /NCGR_PEP_ID=MMETSP0167-20121228/80847_1 /TAXON_ID=38298 /ORGANISM="Rhodella maculata, Strain CCMP736" /LENGTH=157 /DNA_ID=CAMNT_0016159219 /DNA_START=56 /DNA_END=529 /DNA_ORIENTATION=+
MSAFIPSTASIGASLRLSAFRGACPTRTHHALSLASRAPARLPAAAAPVRMVSIETTKDGDGKTFPKAGDRVQMHYHGSLLDGTKFDSSYDRNAPFAFVAGAGQVIPGWDLAVVKLSLGEKARLEIPPEEAYGANGVPGVIPPNSTLLFDVQLMAIN